MVQIIEENREPSLSERFGRAFAGGARQAAQSIPQHLMGQQQQQAENQALQRMGINAAGLSPDLKKLFVEQTLKNQGSKQGSDLSPAIGAISEMEELLSKPGIGMLGRLNPSNESRFNRGKFQSLQAAVLPLFKSMFPRGMTEKEFKHVNENYIPQPGDTIETIKGKISGLKGLLSSGESEMKMPKESKSEMSWVVTPKGKRIQIPSDQLEAALASGGKRG
tara:strand:- start:6717 stop:7379 length:663 start_codon:yes stop_codon:yes gene_type:complete